jgi:hypothetical protein
LLYKDLEAQTHRDWIWFLCSNKYSEKISKFAENKRSENGSQIVYFSIDSGKETNHFNLIASLGRRRDFCLKHAKGDYVFMFDADAKLLDQNMFKTIATELSRTQKNMCIYRIVYGLETLPKFPIRVGGIDTLNFCVKLSLAKKKGWPTTANFDVPYNDWWFFVRIHEACPNYLFIDKVFCEYNGNNCYKTVLTRHNANGEFRLRILLREYISYCLDNYNPLGLIKAIITSSSLCTIGRWRKQREYKTYTLSSMDQGNTSKKYLKMP